MAAQSIATDEPGGWATLRAGAVVVDAGRVHFDAEVQVRNGRIAAIEPVGDLSPAERELVVTPGLVNAHSHLDLGALAGRVEAGPTFLDWVGRIVRTRGELDEEEVRAGARRSAHALLDSGTTATIDIDAAGSVDAALGALPLRTFLLREIIDGSPADWSDRSEAALAGARDALSRRRTEYRAYGISPHGTHTVGDSLLDALAGLDPPAPVGVHWAETPEEGEWLEGGTGPFADWLGPSPRTTGTDRLERAGLLREALLFHGNHPGRGEIERAASAGATVVHCPGSHLFFARPRFDLESFGRASVTLALGTDSWASNDALDMRREMRLVRETLGVDAAGAWRMATEVGARLLPWPEVTGRLGIGDAADLAIFTLGAAARRVESDRGRLLEHLTAAEPEVVGVVVQGRRIRD